MKKFYFRSSLLTLLLSGFAFGQGSETFESQTKLTDSYANGSFSGETAGIVWNYTNARNEATYPITNKGILFQSSGNKLETTISNGIGKLSFDVRKAYTAGTNTRKIEILVDGNVVFTSPTFGTAQTDNTIYHYEVDINKTSSSVIAFRNAGPQITLDNISWTKGPEITEAPVVNSKTIIGTYGVLLTDGTITATNNPTFWTQTGVLPTGISFDKGVFSGTPKQAGTFIAQVTATNMIGTSSPANITFEIAKANQTVNHAFVSISQNKGTTFSDLPTKTDQGQNIVYTSADNSIVSANGNTLSFDGIGSTTITATAIGGNNFNDYTTTFNVNSNDPNATYCFEENFTGLKGDNISSNGSATVWNGNENFTSLVQAFQAGDAVRIGSSSNKGSITSKKLDQISGNVTVSFDVKGWTSVEGSINVTFGTETKNIPYTAKMGDAFENVTVSFENVVAGSTLKLETSAKRAFIDNVRIQCSSSNNSTTWDGTAWSNGTPDLTKDVIIKGKVTVDTQLEAKTFTVSDAGGSVVVKSGARLIVDGKIDNQAGLTGLVVENGGNLIQNQNVANSGAITVNRDSKSMVRNDMTFWSSPVQQEASQQTIRSFSPETLYNRFWTYNETTDEFTQILTSDTDSKLFEPGKGVSIRVKNTLPTGQNTIHNGAFLGVPFNGDITVPVQFTANGYNLVGNPYASNINVEKFLLANENVNSLYFWTHQFPVGSSEYANNYAAFNVVGGVIPDLSNISVGQGFIVGLSQATPTVNFNNTMRTSQDAFFYKNSIAEKNRIWLSLSKESKTISQILLAYMDGATNDADNQIDAKVMQRGSSAIYSLINNEAYAIQGRSLPFKTDDVVKLGFETLEQGNYTINIEKADGLFEKGQIVYLRDKELNQVHNLSESAYSFTSKAGIFDTRFELVYTNKTLGTDELSKENVIVYTKNNTIVVDAKQNKISSVELYDIQGRKIFVKNNIRASVYQVESSAKGILVIKVLTEDGKVKTQKVVNK
ncbi:T9SS type A sorting domain-containing protein [Empedobacter falsenii]|uniref:T9SS type A sorting domain-containing protein n=1 Tax=Empedobacter falsenii TaxID=343874 RepID=A0A7H9DUT5_9FLAO|nr:T9SS type A sorting domain-containing protein [Empedobacter falsenii]QLL58815.1 T9SS type A sorting domain-containing protein [Empedobacter falsenii]